MRITWQSPFGWRCATTAAKILREHLSADDRSWQQCRMNIGCSTQASFGNTIWKLILCPIYHMLALECPYGWYHQHQNHFISLWVSLCDRGNNVLLFFFRWYGIWCSAKRWNQPPELFLIQSFCHAGTRGPPPSVFWKMATRQALCSDSLRKSVFCGGSLTSKTEGRKVVSPLIHLFIRLFWNSRSHLWNFKVVCFYLSIISLCVWCFGVCFDEQCCHLSW